MNDTSKTADRPPLPAVGGSFVRRQDGSIVPAEKASPAATPKSAKKED